MNITDEQLEGYLAGTLPEDEREAVALALAESPALREALALMEVAEQEPVLAQPSAAFWEQVMQRVLRPRTTFRTILQSGLLGSISLRQWYLVAGVLATLVIAGSLGATLLPEAEGLQKQLSSPVAGLMAACVVSFVGLLLLDRWVLRRWFARGK